MSIAQLMEETGLGHHDGYAGVFTKHQAEGAIPNGTKIVKTNSVAGDATPDGMGGVVLGSMDSGDHGLLYFVEWDDRPRMAVGTIALKIKRQNGAASEGSA